MSNDLNGGQWRHLLDMTDVVIRFCLMHEDETFLKGLESLRDVFSTKDIHLAKKAAHRFPMTGMGSFIDPRPLTPLSGEDEEYCNLVFLTLAHAWIRIQTDWPFNGTHPNSLDALA